MRLPLLILHILGGTVGLLAGTFAMAVRKGSRLHRASGNVFTIAMVTLASSALCLAIMKSQRGNVIGSIVTFYMITTAWLAGRRRNIGRSDWAALLLVGLGGAVAVITLGVQTLHHPDENAPSGMSFFFGAVLLLAAAGDIRMLASGGIAGRQRITRHLWRMCFGLFIATGSFFLGQQQVFPAFLRGSIFLTVLAVLPFPLMIYWLFRVRFSKAYRAGPPPMPVDSLRACDNLHTPSKTFTP
ncbi:MAG: hypothetical protein WA824_08360 [Candidatus Sulfotelmatobacter sp.]